MRVRKISLREQHITIASTLLVWFLLILALGHNQSFVPEQGTPPLNIILSGIITVSLFFLAYWSMPEFKNYVLKIDMRFLIMLHSWRMLGMGFIMLYMFDKLPPLFAYLAGIGDAVTAVAAVFLAYALFTKTHGVSKKLVWRWNTFGIVDFIIAVTVGILSQTDGVLYTANGADADIMVQFPLVLIPGFLVQVFTITHLIIYLQLSNNFNKEELIKI